MASRSARVYAASILLLLLLGWAVYSYVTGGAIHAIILQDEDAIRQLVEGFGVFAPLVFVIIIVLEVVLGPVPGGPLYFVAGVLFHPLLGGTLALLGNMIGAAIAFLLARLLGRGWVERLAKDSHLQHLDKMSGKHGPLVIFLLRINPFTSTDILSYLAGLSRMRFSSFLIATTLGLAPLAYLFAYAGDIFLDSALLFSLVIWLSVLYVLVIAGYVLYLGAKKASKRKTRPRNREDNRP